LAGAGWLILSNIGFLIGLTASAIGLVALLAVLAGLIFILLDSRFRNLMFYGYKSIMRFITGIFIQIDPIGVLKSYIDDLKSNLKKMDKQLANLRGQMRKLKNLITQNEQAIKSNLAMASEAKKQSKRNVMILKSRKAGRMQESNLKLSDLYNDVGAKVGEMERFMEMSGNFMNSIDLQNGVFEEEGLQMLEKWEKEGVSMILGDDKDLLVMQGNSDGNYIDLDAPIEKGNREENQYEDLFKSYNN